MRDPSVGLTVGRFVNELSVLRQEEHTLTTEIAKLQARRTDLEEEMERFQNNSGVDISLELKARLTHALNDLKMRSLQDGLTVDEAATKVAVLFMPDGGGDIATLVPKNELRSFLADYEKYASAVNTAKVERDQPLVEEKLILSCMRDLPRGAMRVLFISTELCGTLQVHTSSMVEIKSDEDKVAEATTKIVEALKPYPKKLSREILERVRNENLVIEDLRNELLARDTEAPGVAAKFDALIPEFREKWLIIQQRALKAPLPPSSNTATNVEALLMAAAYVLEPMNNFDQFADLTGEQKTDFAQVVANLIGVFAHNSPAVLKLLAKMEGCLKGKPYSSHLQDFGNVWMHSGFPKLEVGHKLAASLCMTDVPDDIEVMAPWKAWSLIVPPGLFGEKPGEETYARIWCIGAEPHFFIMTTGEIVGPFTRKGWLEMFKDAEKAVSAIGYAIDSLIRGACLALANPNEYKRQTLKEKAAGGAKKPQRDGDPDFTASRFMLSAPVMVDARPHLLDFVSGKKHKAGAGGGAPTVQFFVRGHWRNQAHGPRLSLRKQMRIEGYWKGDQTAAILLRNYKVKDDDIDSGAKGKDAEQHSDPGTVQRDADPVPSG